MYKSLKKTDQIKKDLNRIYMSKEMNGLKFSVPIIDLIYDFKLDSLRALIGLKKPTKSLMSCKIVHFKSI